MDEMKQYARPCEYGSLAAERREEFHDTKAIASGHTFRTSE
jgi:hypothetical protein